MFKVEPIRSRELQAEIASALDVNFFEDTYAFLAIELTDSGDSVISIIGMCQFEYSQNGAVIKSIAAAPDKKSDEAVVIMVRTVMNFCYRAEIPSISVSCIAESESVSTATARGELTGNIDFLGSLGFRKSNGYAIDLREFYKSPCHYSK